MSVLDQKQTVNEAVASDVLRPPTSIMRCTKKRQPRQVDRRAPVESDIWTGDRSGRGYCLGGQSWASSQNKNKKGRNAMLVQIDQNSATVTPFGSLSSACNSADANGGGQSFGRRPNA